jgi:hypothetical protein
VPAVLIWINVSLIDWKPLWKNEKPLKRFFFEVFAGKENSTTEGLPVCSWIY